MSLEQRNAGIPRKTKTSQECSWERAEVASVVSPQEGSEKDKAEISSIMIMGIQGIMMGQVNISATIAPTTS